jgi:hypothetical protein
MLKDQNAPTFQLATTSYTGERWRRSKTSMRERQMIQTARDKPQSEKS